MTNKYLMERGIHIARSILIRGDDEHEEKTNSDKGRGILSLAELTEEVCEGEGFSFPAILKPVRGRGSQGVVKVNSLAHLKEVASSLLAERDTVEYVGGEGKEKEYHPPPSPSVISVPRYGDVLILEEFLDGDELTVTVMPPGEYSSSILSGRETGKEAEKEAGGYIQLSMYTSLPPVLRFNHHDGVAPYNGVVAVVQNSRVLR